jgi:integrase
MAISYQRRRRRGGFRWTATVRRDGTCISATFPIKDQATHWAVDCERAIIDATNRRQPFDRAEWVRRGRKPTLRPGDPLLAGQAEIDADETPRADWTLKKALEHYKATVTANNKGERQEANRIDHWIANKSLSQLRLNEVKAEHLADWQKSRTKTKRTKDNDGNVRVFQVPVAGSTVRNDLFRLSALYNLARKAKTKGGWGLALSNPVEELELPRLDPSRQRRLDHEGGGEWPRLLRAIKTGPDGQEMTDFVWMLYETGMRRSELLDLRAGEVRTSRLGGRYIARGDSKNDGSRNVVLSVRATKIVDRLRQGKGPRERLFRMDADNVAWRWRRALREAGITNLRLHDLRHEALSQLAEAGLHLTALKQLSGHKSDASVIRYINSAEPDIREKLARRRLAG